MAPKVELDRHARVARPPRLSAVIVGAAATAGLGCGNRTARAVPDPAADARPETPSEMVLPLVSGCGCAYQCGRGLRVGPDGVWEVTHDFQDSVTTRAVIERWCFDAAGHAYPEKGAPVAATYCRRVFYDRTPCGGECIPSTAWVRCGEK
ncbi:MAG: hypothetical protein HYV09_12425 [Deltaproteobacteria bacterium]|nr:hypothetical protein [Deltaproteobacteria bacterium]